MKKELEEAMFMSVLSLGFIVACILAYAFFGEEPKEWDKIFWICLIVFVMVFLAMLVGAAGDVFNNDSDSAHKSCVDKLSDKQIEESVKKYHHQKKENWEEVIE